jgi:glyoxylase-like metal-dependent hydrolase (beta-lactamase superfamily II)
MFTLAASGGPSLLCSRWASTGFKKKTRAALSMLLRAGLNLDFIRGFELHDSSMRNPNNHLSRVLGALALGLVGALAACEGDEGPAGPAGPAGPPGSAGQNGAGGQGGGGGSGGGGGQGATAVQRLVASFGGDAAVRGLRTMTAKSSGERLQLSGWYRPEDTYTTCTFELDTRWDVDADNLRLDYGRTLFYGPPVTFSEYLLKAGGFREGVDNLFSIPGGPMASERWSSARRQQRLLHPELIVRDLVLDPNLVKGEGLGSLEGREYSRVEVAGPSNQPITLWVDVETGKLSKLSTVENRFPSGDVPVEAHFSDWQPAGDLSLPRRAELSFDGAIVHVETRSEVGVNGVLGPDVFAVPGGAAVSIDADAAARGERDTQYYEQFIALGYPVEGVATTVEPVELKPGVWHLLGASHNTMVVEQEAGVVVIEAPLYAARSQAILAWIKQQFPSKPVTHLVATHHHDDHSGGFRDFVAAGAQLVVGQEGVNFFEKSARAPRTVEPDALAQSPKPPRIIPVASGSSLTLKDAARPVTIYGLSNTHAADLVMAVAEGVAFVSDAYNPGQFVDDYQSRQLRDEVKARDIPVDLYAGGHGSTATPAELDAALDP